MAAGAALRAGAPWPWPWLWLAALQAVTVYGTQLSSEACRELGFSSNLLCSSCNLLGQFSLNQLDPFCRQCCQEEAQLESRKILQIFGLAGGNNCHQRGRNMVVQEGNRCHQCGVRGKICEKFQPGTLMGRVLSLTAFVRSDKPKLFRGLQIKYVRGSDPVLKLLDDSGNIAEELSILKWNTDSVEEFLSEKLERL